MVSGKYLLSITPGFATPVCNLVGLYRATGVSTKVISQTVTLAFNSSTGAWSCSSSLPAEIKPKACT